METATAPLNLHGVEIVDTFAEAFPITGARLIITAASRKWAWTAATVMTGNATSVIACDCEAGIERLMLDTWKKRVVLKHPLIRDGNEKPDIEGYGDGVFFLKAKNSTSPEIVDRNFTRLTEADKKFYAGCYVNASIELWIRDNKYGKRINASLRGVQFVKDGEPFSGGGVAVDDEFEALETAGDDLW